MTIRDDYANQMAATLKQWSTQMRDLQAKAQAAGAEQKARAETAVAALKVQQTAYQDQMKKVQDSSESALADMRQGAERMAKEFARSYAQAAGRFAV